MSVHSTCTLMCHLPVFQCVCDHAGSTSAAQQYRATEGMSWLRVSARCVGGQHSMKMITNLVVLPLCMTHTHRDLPKCGWCVSSLLWSGGWSESEGPVYDARPAGYECWWKVETTPLISFCLPTLTHSLIHLLPSANTHWPIIKYS